MIKSDFHIFKDKKAEKHPKNVVECVILSFIKNIALQIIILFFFSGKNRFLLLHIFNTKLVFTFKQLPN